MWNSALEETLFQKGVKFLQGSGNQKMPTDDGMRVLKHSFGERNNSGQTYMLRNCIFEPSLNKNKNWIESALKEMSIAFFMEKASRNFDA